MVAHSKSCPWTVVHIAGPVEQRATRVSAVDASLYSTAARIVSGMIGKTIKKTAFLEALDSRSKKKSVKLNDGHKCDMSLHSCYCTQENSRFLSVNHKAMIASCAIY